MKYIKQLTYTALAFSPVFLFAQGYIINNPLKGVTSLEQVVLNVIKIFEILLIMATVLYLLYAGLMFVTARGEPAKISKARDALLWGMVGAGLVLCARIIATAIQGTVQGLLG